jgi:hypothetical protein
MGRWLVWAAAATLVASSVAVAASDVPRPAGARPAANPSPHASQRTDEPGLVERVQELFSPAARLDSHAEGSDRCGTPLLLELEGRWSTLSPQTQAALSRFPVALQARGLSAAGLPSLGDEPALRLETAHFSVHYSIVGANAVPPTDSDEDGLPDYVEAVATAMEISFQSEVDRLDWTAPPLDGARYDVLLLSAGVDGMVAPYGTTHWDGYAGDNPNSPDLRELHSAYSFIVLNTALTPNQLRVTAAHEFCHAIQLGYNGDVRGWDSRRWLMEATSTWMESEVWPSIHDNVWFLRALFDEPDESAFDEDLWYADWLFLRYISEHWGGPDTLRDIWRNGATMSGDWAVPSLAGVLALRGATFDRVFGGYAIANLMLAPCDVTPGPYCYRDALLYREMMGSPRIEGRVVLTPPSGLFLPPDGVRPLGADYLQLLPSVGWMKIGVYGQDPRATYSGSLVAVRGTELQAWPLRVNPGTGAPEVALQTGGYDALYLVITNLSTSGQLESARYGVAYFAGDSALPTPTRAPADKRAYLPLVSR